MKKFCAGVLHYQKLREKNSDHDVKFCRERTSKIGKMTVSYFFRWELSGERLLMLANVLDLTLFDCSYCLERKLFPCRIFHDDILAKNVCSAPPQTGGKSDCLVDI